MGQDLLDCVGLIHSVTPVGTGTLRRASTLLLCTLGELSLDKQIKEEQKTTEPITEFSNYFLEFNISASRNSRLRRWTNIYE